MYYFIARKRLHELYNRSLRQLYKKMYDEPLYMHIGFFLSYVSS